MKRNIRYYTMGYGGSVYMEKALYDPEAKRLIYHIYLYNKDKKSWGNSFTHYTESVFVMKNFTVKELPDEDVFLEVL